MIEHVNLQNRPTDPRSITVDHIYARRRHDLSIRAVWWQVANRVYACQGCNGRKGDMEPIDWLKVMPADGCSRYARRLMRLGVSATSIAVAWAGREDMPGVTSAKVLEKLLTYRRHDRDKEDL